MAANARGSPVLMQSMWMMGGLAERWSGSRRGRAPSAGGAAFQVATELEDPGGTYDAGRERATDRRQQEHDPERNVAARAEETDVHATSGVLEDEHEQQGQHDCAGNERAGRSSWSAVRSVLVGGLPEAVRA
jgi:hypothetical protein